MTSSKNATAWTGTSLVGDSTSLAFFFQNARGGGSPERTLEALQESATDSPELAEALRERSPLLATLLTAGPTYRVDEARARALGSFGHSLFEAEATWDIRPATDDQGNVVTFAPVLVMRLMTTANSNDEVTFQMSRLEFKRFREMMEELAGSLKDADDCADNLSARLSEEPSR